MTGPEHYREAERLLARADHFIYGDGADPVTGAATAAQAQGHALLALAAATVDAGEPAGYASAWNRAMGRTTEAIS